MSMSDYKPPFDLTSKIVNLSIEISEQAGRMAALEEPAHLIMLRKKNRIRTIHSSLSIEGNTLSAGQVTALLDGKRVSGSEREIREVQNAGRAYGKITELSPYSIDDLLVAHSLMMDGLIQDSGRFRQGGVGIFRGGMPVHIAPPAHLVPFQIRDLMDWHESEAIHPLIKSAVFHYEFEYIHPFSDGNGRMGRFWHSLLLGSWKEIFYHLPVEEQIRERQAQYYEALGKADELGNSTPFVEFWLEVTKETLLSLPEPGWKPQQEAPFRLYEALGNEELSPAGLPRELSQASIGKRSYRNDHP